MFQSINPTINQAEREKYKEVVNEAAHKFMELFNNTVDETTRSLLAKAIHKLGQTGKLEAERLASFVFKDPDNPTTLQKGRITQIIEYGQYLYCSSTDRSILLINKKVPSPRSLRQKN